MEFGGKLGVRGCGKECWRMSRKSGNRFAAKTYRQDMPKEDMGKEDMPKEDIGKKDQAKPKSRAHPGPIR
jgi:hypothetical protein